MPSDFHPMYCQCRLCTPHPRRGVRRYTRNAGFIALCSFALWAALLFPWL